MREDLPCEERLPKLWAISLAEGGDLIDARPRLEEFDVVEPLHLEESRWRCWRVKDKNRVKATSGGSRDGGGSRHVLSEFRCDDEVVDF